MLLFERSATVAADELAKLFVEGDKKSSSEVLVNFKCCSNSTAQVLIARKPDRNSNELSFTLLVTRADEPKVHPGKCQCLCHENPGRSSVPLPGTVFKPAPIKGKGNVQVATPPYSKNKSNESDPALTECKTSPGADPGSGAMDGEKEDSTFEGVPCQFCEKVFVSERTLLKHMKNNHKHEADLESNLVPTKENAVKEPTVVQNPDGTSVITVPPDFWKDDELKRSTQDEDEKSSSTEIHYDDDDEVIDSLHDVMGDFGGDSNEEVEGYGEEEDVGRDDDDGDEDFTVEEDDIRDIKKEGKGSSQRIKKRHRDDGSEEESVYRKVKAGERSENVQITSTRRQSRKKVFKDFVEIESDESETEDHISEDVDNRQKKAQNGNTEMMLSTQGTADKYVQTVASYQMSTGVHRVGKMMTCSGNYLPVKPNSSSLQNLLVIENNSKYIQTGQRKRGKVMYPSTDLQAIKRESSSIYDCTFHKYCIANKTKFNTKEELTKHIVAPFKDQSDGVKMWRSPETSKPKSKKAKKSDDRAEVDGDSVGSSVNDDNIFNKAQLSKQIASSFIAASGITASDPVHPPNVEEVLYDCPVCTSQFSIPQSLYAHMQNDHSQAMVSNNTGRLPGRNITQDNQQAFQQSIENPTTSLQPNAPLKPAENKVVLSTNELTEIVYPCPVCKAIFYHDFELESHIKTVHIEKDEESDMEEEDEEEMVEDEQNPVTNMMKAVGSKAETEKAGPSGRVQQPGLTRCPICPSSLALFGNVNDLQVHLTETHGVHTKVVNLSDKKSADDSMSKYGGHYECPVCALLFSTSADMYTHLNSSHMKQVRKSWHKTPNHKSKEPVQKRRRRCTGKTFQCTQCSLAFRTQKELMLHAEFKH